MTSHWNKIFTKNKDLSPNHQVLKFDLEDYDVTYAVPKTLFKFIALKLTHDDNKSIRLSYAVLYWFEFVNIVIAVALQSANVTQNVSEGSFMDFFTMLPCMGYSIISLMKSSKIVLRRSVYENLENELRGMWPQGTVTKEEYDIISTSLRQLRFIIKGYSWCNVALLVMFSFPSFMAMMRRASGQDVPLVLLFAYWLPFDPFQRGCYEIMLIIEFWHCALVLAFMLAGDLLFCIFLSHITTQFDLLALRIRRLVYVPIDKQLIDDFPLGKISRQYIATDYHSVQSFDDSDWERKHLKDIAEIVVRHRDLIRLSSDVEDLFSLVLLFNFLNSSIVLCFCGFCCVFVEKWNEMGYKSFIVTALSQIWLICWYGEKLLESSEGVSEALYSCGWYKASKRIRSSILIMLHRAQTPVHITTLGFSVISLTSFTKIIKTSWSYFTLLINVYKQPT